ncbi:DUF4376 domain-containing protein [Methylobacterium sp. 1973]|uniref:DUF4376 domain-containing protein n=1 Tax=Methylobacterium sp. 1973 TaxID=3156421 RepID=UPI00339B99EB
MTDRIVYTDATGSVGSVFCAEYPNGFYGPLPPREPANAAIYARLLAAGVQAQAYAPPPVDLAAYIADAHAALRDGGVTIGGMRIKTDAESRGLIDGAYALSQAQPEKTIDFKAASGWVGIDSQTMQTVAVAVGQWVQACYSAYRKLDEGRAAGTVTTTAQVDAAFTAVALPS